MTYTVICTQKSDRNVEFSIGVEGDTNESVEDIVSPIFEDKFSELGKTDSNSGKYHAPGKEIRMTDDPIQKDTEKVKVPETI